jgi:hypothetical protein
MSALPPTDRGGPNCTCHACTGQHCLLPHWGHSHTDYEGEHMYRVRVDDMERVADNQALVDAFEVLLKLSKSKRIGLVDEATRCIRILSRNYVCPHCGK